MRLKINLGNQAQPTESKNENTVEGNKNNCREA